MVNEVLLNSNTYTDGSTDEGVGKRYMGNGGHKLNLLRMLSDFIIESATRIALTGASLSATSTTSMAIANSGSIPFTMSTGKGFAVGSRIRVARTSAPTTTWMEGVITAFNATTGATTFTADNSLGSGTFTDWTISIAGTQGVAGTPSPYISTAGTSTAYTATFSPAITSHAVGVPLLVKFHTACGASPAITINGLSSKNLVNPDGTGLAANAAKSGQVAVIAYDGTAYQVLGGSGSGGGETLVTPVVGAGASQALNYASGNVFDLTGTASTACTLSFSNLPSSGTVGRFRLLWKQPAVTGGSTLVWPGAVKWLGRSPQTSAPTFNTAAGFVHEIDFITDDGGTNVYAVMVGGSTIASPSPTSGTYIAACSNGYVLASSDGTAFTKSSQQLSGLNLTKVIYHGSRFQVMGNDGVARDMSGNGVYTTNGSSFTAWPASSTDNLLTRNILYTTGSVLCYGKDASNNVFWKSTDDMTSISSSGVSSGGNGDYQLHTTDGSEGLLIIDPTSSVNFCAATNLTGSGLSNSQATHSGLTGIQTGCFYGNGNWIVLSAAGNIGYKAAPGTAALTQVSSVVGAVPLRYGLWTGSKWVAAGDSGKLCNSSSIATWTSRTTGVAGNITGIANTGGTVIIVTDQGEIARSTDHGDSWTVLTTPTNNPFGGSALKFVKFMLNQFWTGGVGQKIGCSSDGSSFTLVPTGSGTETINDFWAV